MEAADDIAYCVSDIEDGIEKGLIGADDFAGHMLKERENIKRLAKLEGAESNDERDVRDILKALKDLAKRPSDLVENLSAMNDFRSGVVRLLARHAGRIFRHRHGKILSGGDRSPLLSECEASHLLEALQDFATSSLYSAQLVRSREITGHAVLYGLLDAYLPLMTCDDNRFEKAIAGERRDADGLPIARDSSLISRIPPKHLAVYREEVRQMKPHLGKDEGATKVMERIHRMRLLVDYISGMTDEFALRTFQVISGMQIPGI
jgi:dGTPase